MCKIICDKCSNFEVHSSGVSQRCNYDVFNDNNYIPRMPKDYVDDRMSGNKKSCKEFKKLDKEL